MVKSVDLLNLCEARKIMSNIIINKSETADTRTCDFSKVTKDTLLNSSRQHIKDVMKGFDFFIERMENAALLHDNTKITEIDGFYDDFKTGFEKQDWYKMHQDKERHHLKNKEYVQDDVNLVDVFEMVIDCVMAGLARSGKYTHEDIDPEVLQKAVKNTADMLIKAVSVK